ncbi:MAG: HAD-IB family phosphatase [Candidatus Eisenbacteria bacterium]|nr:HAD-IB family phosphatase [Candidatus Eisenbacteria bacterium]
MMRLVFLCDFDGTVSPTDIGKCFIERFTPAPGTHLPELERRWRSGEFGHRELTKAECESVRCGAAEAGAFADGFRLDPHFAPFARTALERGDEVCVLSEGFDFYIRALLEREGLLSVPYFSNHLRFEGDRVVPEFPYHARSCGRCGNCKGAHVRDWRSRGYRTVLVGDGLSDRCAAREADVVLARDSLLEWCRSEGRAAREFGTFADVAAIALELERGAAEAGRIENGAVPRAIERP